MRPDHYRQREVIEPEEGCPIAIGPAAICPICCHRSFRHIPTCQPAKLSSRASEHRRRGIYTNHNQTIESWTPIPEALESPSMLMTARLSMNPDHAYWSAGRQARCSYRVAQSLAASSCPTHCATK
jgi:hypothetical protein